ncbi:uncharacterized protein LOC117190179 isoform X2 [Drosophila miranda]|uniref:uncharacterized protein LOC117190179 isoform X1 n=1 Tax=Drosophila miranda TaxID=7229 RepID=UPI00143F8945|nr:uncharacterized protein LOC117190179 isoform X1 [Drosophila miranda]XP_033251131.1 uncharacterized protein LOC117190179 isoform X2 [Drosophila miranda]
MSQSPSADKARRKSKNSVQKNCALDSQKPQAEEARQRVGEKKNREKRVVSSRLPTRVLCSRIIMENTSGPPAGNMQQNEGPSGSEENRINRQQNAIEEAMRSTLLEENTQTLQQLVQLLSMKINADEIDKKNDAKLVVENFAKIIPEFNGENMSVQQWFINFELNAEAYGLNDKQKYVQARAKMTGTAALFLESTAVYEYGQLRHQLLQEFECERLCSAQIHNQLSMRVKMAGESFHEYILQMKRIAARGTTDTESVIRYIVDGLNLKTDYKYTLYGCSSYKQLREKYEIYERTLAVDGGLAPKQKDSQPFGKKSNFTKYERKQHCYNCGSQEHLRKDCRAALKCFRCN